MDASKILVWADEWQVGEAIEASLTGVGHTVRHLADDAELATLHQRDALLVAQCGPRLEAQLAFLHGPIIVVEAGRPVAPALAARAYAVVAQPAEAGHAVDRFVEHRQLAATVPRVLSAIVVGDSTTGPGRHPAKVRAARARWDRRDQARETLARRLEGA